MVLSDSIPSEDYNALRMRVQLLKQQHVDAVHQQLVHKDVDVASIASRCAHLEAVNAALTAENGKLQQQLRQTTERSAKIRRQHEREQLKLREQVDTLTASASTVDENWSAKLAASEAAAAARVKQLEAELERLKQQQEAERKQLQKEHEAKLQDTDEWCHGEIEAVQHQARHQVAQAHAAVEQWQQKYDEAMETQKKAADVNEQLQQEVNELRRALQATQAELQQAEGAIARLQQDESEQQAAFDEEKRALLRQHADQMDMKRAQHAEHLAHIEGRLQVVVAKKDATISALRAELQGTYSTLLPLKSI